MERQGDGDIEFHPGIGCLFAKHYDLATIDIPDGLPPSDIGCD